MRNSFPREFFFILQLFCTFLILSIIFLEKDLEGKKICYIFAPCSIVTQTYYLLNRFSNLHLRKDRRAIISISSELTS